MVKHDKRGEGQNALPLLQLSHLPSHLETPAPLSKWDTFIDGCTSPSLHGGSLSPGTADNYKRYARLWWKAVVLPNESLEKIPAETLLERTGDYFQKIGKKNRNTCRSIRSLVCGKFLPWCIDQELCQISPQSITRFSPLSFHKFNSPVVEKFLEHSTPLLCTLSIEQEEAHSYFRALYFWIATHHLEYQRTALKADARPILQSELELLNSGVSTSSPSHWLFTSENNSSLFISTRRPPFPKDKAHVLFTSFITWGKEAFSSPKIKEIEGLSTLLTPSPHFKSDMPKLPSRPLLDRIPERRGNLSKQLQESTYIRDSLIDHLIQNHTMSLADIHKLNSQPTVDFELQEMLMQYTSKRNNGLLELHLDPKSMDIPFFVSADGGSLIVTEEPVLLKKNISAETIVREALKLITHLIREEQLPFEQARTMTFVNLRRMSFSQSTTVGLIDTYARQLQVSALQFFSLSSEGPGWAFPAVDGDVLTADA